MIINTLGKTEVAINIDKYAIIEFAKNLFLLRKKYQTAEHLHSFADIAKLLEEKFHRKYSPDTIQKWASQYDWNSDWEDIQNGVTGRISREKILENFEKNVSGMMEFTGELEDYLRELLRDKKLSPKIAAEIYTQLMNQHTKLLDVKKSIDAETQGEKNKVETTSDNPFIGLLPNMLEEFMTEYEKKKTGTAIDAEYSIVEEDKNVENSD